MAIAASTIRTNFARTYKGSSDAYAYQLLNEVDLLITRHFGLRKKTLSLSVTASNNLLTIDSGAVWIESARWVDAPAATPGNVGGFSLKESSVDEEDTDELDWRANPPGIPNRFMQTHSLIGGQLEFDVPPLYGTLIVTAATNATPIVVTTSAAHGLSDGARVDILNGLVNTNVNGNYYADVLSPTTFALYTDSDLTVAVAGNGAYTANSALLSCLNSPYLQLFTRWHVDLTSSDNLPDTPMFPSLYVDGMCFLYAKRHDSARVAEFKALFEDVVTEQIKITQNRTGRNPNHMRVVNQRKNGAVQSRWGRDFARQRNNSDPNWGTD